MSRVPASGVSFLLGTEARAPDGGVEAAVGGDGGVAVGGDGARATAAVGISVGVGTRAAVATPDVGMAVIWAGGGVPLLSVSVMSPTPSCRKSKPDRSRASIRSVSCRTSSSLSPPYAFFTANPSRQAALAAGRTTAGSGAGLLNFSHNVRVPNKCPHPTQYSGTAGRWGDPMPECTRRLEISRAADLSMGRKFFSISTWEMRAVEQLTFNAATTEPSRLLMGTAMDLKPTSISWSLN